MEKNIGRTDSFMRLLIGIVFLTNFFILEQDSILGIVLLFFGILFIFNFILEYSLFYELLKINTIRK